MTDKYKSQHASKNDVIDLTSKNDVVDLTSNSNDVISISSSMRGVVDIQFNGDNDDEDIFDDGLSMMHRLGSVSCTVRCTFDSLSFRYKT